MHIEFLTITLCRFKSFVTPQELDFDSAGVGLYFLKGENQIQSGLGSNGAGKSSIIDAFVWCLFGKTLGGLRNPDIVSWQGKGTTKVGLLIKIDGEFHSIERTANPNLLTFDGNEIGQEYITKHLGLTFDALPYTIVFGQRQPLFFDLTSSEKLKVFSQFLDRWDARSDHAKAMAESLDKELAAKMGQISQLESKIEYLKTTAETWKAKSEEWEVERQDALKNQNKDRSTIEKMLASLQPQKDTADLGFEKCELELRQSKVDDWRKKYRGVRLGIDSKNLTLKASIREKAQLEAELVSNNQEVCPTCGTALDKKEIDKLKKSIRASVTEHNKEIAKIEKEIEAEKKIQDELYEMIECEEQSLQALKHESNNYKDQILRLDRQIAEFNAQLKALDKRIEDYEKQDNPFNEEVRRLRKEITKNKASLEEATKAYEAKKVYFDNVLFWVKGFKEVKLYTLEEILQELEITTNSMLDEFGLNGWSIKYDVERETKSGTISKSLNVFVYSPTNKDPVKWESWSGGEAQRLRLIGSAALSSVLLNHLGLTSNLEVYDEPTESLSKEGVNDLVELLAYRAKSTKKSIWFVDHHAVESAKFVSSTTIQKSAYGSMLL